MRAIKTLAHEPPHFSVRRPSARLFAYFTETEIFFGFTDSSFGIVMVRTPLS